MQKDLGKTGDGRALTCSTSECEPKSVMFPPLYQILHQINSMWESWNLPNSGHACVSQRLSPDLLTFITNDKAVSKLVAEFCPADPNEYAIVK